MHNAFFEIRKPVNEPIFTYAKGTPQREELTRKLAEMKKDTLEIPCIIGGKEIKTGNMGQCVEPHNKSNILANYHIAGPGEIKMAIDAALCAKREWENMPWEHRVAIFLKAAQLISTKYRMTLNAATMLGQSKNAYQAEIDSACELIDFLRFNAYFLSEIYKEQPLSVPEHWNRVEYRALEGFVAAVTPFNFTAIAGNLNASPAICGNTLVWKPSSTSVYSNYFVMRIFQEAGLPAGVINFVPSKGVEFGEIVFRHPELAGIHFTGSTQVFKTMWKTLGENIENSKYYPRLVGETGGKDFVFAHKSADVTALATALICGSFEYQGQKCSAASRAYIPRSIWPEVEAKLKDSVAKIKVGDVSDFTNLVNAVIDANAFNSIKSYIEHAKASSDAEVIIGGGCNDSKGYFVEPTVIVAKKHDYKTMLEEIFGPVLTVFVYDDKDYEETLAICAGSCSYALTGAIFSQDRNEISRMERALVDAAGNFYINDKPTGAVVGQQPFGGARGSGTNDKAGSKLNLYRWISARSMKETFNPPVSFEYPFMK